MTTVLYKPEGSTDDIKFKGDPPKCENCGRDDHWHFEWGDDDALIIAICFDPEDEITYAEWCSTLAFGDAHE